MRKKNTVQFCAFCKKPKQPLLSKCSSGKKQCFFKPASDGLKILFLDVDGVLNCRTTYTKGSEFFGIDPYMVLLVHRIIEATGCKVVLSSSWRHTEAGRKIVKKAVPFIDITPSLYGEGMTRGHEIDAWVRHHPDVSKYAILDDDSDMLAGQPLFKTTWDEGLTQAIVDEVVAYLNS